MTILELNNVAKTYGANTILNGISFKANRGEKIGLIGENGCGKSTLLKMIAGAEAVTSGAISSPKGLRIGYLAQHLEYQAGSTVYQEILRVFDPIKRLEAEVKAAETAMGNPDIATDERKLQKAMAKYGRLQETFEHRGGYTYRQRIDAVLEGLRISGIRDRCIDALSGGEKNVVALARVLLQQPDVLLLDEPANHLDFEGLAWLEAFLQSYDKTVILVSHNRYLLDRVVTRILEIEDTRLAAYTGNYSAYRAEKMRNLLKQKAAYEDQQKEIRRLEEMIKRFELWASIVVNPRHAKQARSKQKMLDRMDKIDRPNLDRKRIDPRFDFNGRSGKIALQLNGYAKAFGNRTLFDHTDLHLSFGDRVGLLGANGTGKTTLFKDILAHAAWENPVLRIGPQTRIGYYAQEHETLDPQRTILEEVCRTGGITKNQGFAVLSRFLFGWEDMDKRVGALSGGEKSRVQFARLMVSDVNFLLLDEPTNHLDIQSREQVEEALEEFEGTILVISHDRYFLDRIVDRIVEIQPPCLAEYPGNFTAFWEKTRTERRTVPAAQRKRPVARKKKDATASPIPPKPDRIETEIDKLEAEKLRIEQSLTDAYRRADYKRGERLSRDLRRIENRIERLYAAL